MKTLTKKLTKKLKTKALELWQDESGQGTAEYVLILVGVVAVALIFRNRIGDIVRKQLEKVTSGMGKINV